MVVDQIGRHVVRMLLSKFGGFFTSPKEESIDPSLNIVVVVRHCDTCQDCIRA